MRGLRDTVGRHFSGIQDSPLLMFLFERHKIQYYFDICVNANLILLQIQANNALLLSRSAAHKYRLNHLKP